MRLDGKGAVVTGGGRGIGAAVARALADAGAAVVVAARSRDEIGGLADELRAEGHDAAAIPCDVTVPEDVEALARQAEELLGGVDILINSAGVAFSAPIRKTGLDDWNRVLAVNATGTFLCMRAFVGGMVERGWGRVINIASVAGLSGARYIAAYSASKHAMIGLTRCVAAELGGHGVTVNAVCPGYVDTEMTRESLDRIVEVTGKSRDEALAAILGSSPQRRLITVDEVAHAVLALCDEEARGVNGSSLVIDGGGRLA